MLTLWLASTAASMAAETSDIMERCRAIRARLQGSSTAAGQSAAQTVPQYVPSTSAATWLSPEARQALQIFGQVGIYSHEQIVNFMQEASRIYYTDMNANRDFYRLATLLYVNHCLIDSELDGNNVKETARLQAAMRKLDYDRILKRFYEYMARTTKRNPAYDRGQFNRIVKEELTRCGVRVHGKAYLVLRFFVNQLPFGDGMRAIRLGEMRSANTAQISQARNFLLQVEQYAQARGYIQERRANSALVKSEFGRLLGNLSGTSQMDNLALSYSVSVYGTRSERAYLAPLINSTLLGSWYLYHGLSSPDAELRSYYLAGAMLMKARSDPDTYNWLQQMRASTSVRTGLDSAAYQAGQIPLGTAHPQVLQVAKATQRNNILGFGIKSVSLYRTMDELDVFEGDGKKSSTSGTTGSSNPSTLGCGGSGTGAADPSLGGGGVTPGGGGIPGR